MLFQTIITILGIFVLFFFTITRLFSFYGVGSEWYGIYMAFYAFIMLSLVILPKKIPTLVEPVLSTQESNFAPRSEMSLGSVSSNATTTSS
jgi:hypothetical protein